MSRTLLITNFILFQVGWLACVLGGANEMALAGSTFMLVVIAFHLWRAQSVMPELRLIVVSLGIGVMFESLLTLSNIHQFTSGILLEGFAPYWMVLLWGLFATTLNVSMRWIKNLSTPVVALLGATLAPPTYFAGNRLGAVVFSNTTLALITIALGWALLFPLLVTVARRHDGYTLTKNS